MNLSKPDAQHDYARATERRGPLRPTADHLTLLTRSCWDYDAYCEFGAAIQNPKRPYGNSDVEDDLAELLPHLSDEDRLKRHLEIPAVLSWISRNLPGLIAERAPAAEPVETSGLSELEQYAADLLFEHARDVEHLTIHEMAPEHLGREITDDEAREVEKLMTRAEIVIGFPDGEDAGQDVTR